MARRPGGASDGGAEPGPGAGRRVKLPARLLGVAGLVPEGAVVADIGTDHALLPVYLVTTGKCPRVIASDVRPGPLEAARATVRAFGVERHVELRLGFGLAVLQPHEADAVVIAGVGGHSIAAILERSPAVRDSVRRFVLQPAKGAAFLRRWLADHGFRLVAEELAREGNRFHEAMAAEAGREEVAHPLLRELGLEVGPRLWEGRHPLLRSFLEDKLDRCRRILARMEASGLGGDRSLPRFRHRAAVLQALLGELDGAPAAGPGGGGA